MAEESLSPTAFFDLSDPQTAALFTGCRTAWEPLFHIKTHVARLVGDRQQIYGKVAKGAWIGDAPIFIAEDAIVEPGVFIVGPAYIGAGAVLRQGAYVRENVILLDRAMIGHASEAKNSIFLPGAHAPHLNYVGDSILGTGANLGAGTKLSNLEITSEKDPVSGKRPTIRFQMDGETVDTGLTKFGAVLGDGVQTGCNAVLNPGVLVGPRSLIYPNLSVRKGYHPPDSIIRLRQNVSTIGRRK
jgi:NDP-sugar pyrophosphorylase family protein